MKFEDIIKNKINQHKEVYNPTAWEKLSARLDVVAPVKTATVSKLTIGLISATAVIALIIVGGIYLNSNDKAPITEVTKEQIKTKKQPDTNIAEVTTSTQTSSDKTNSTHTQEKANPLAIENSSSIPHEDSPEINDILPKKQVANNGDKSVVTSSTPTPPTRSQQPNLVGWDDMVCNDTQVLTNQNAEELVISRIGINQSIRLQSGETLATKNLTTGTYHVFYQGKEVKVFELIKTETPDLMTESIVYDKGLPFIPAKVSLTDHSSTISWKYNGKEISSDKAAFIPAFKKGKETVELTVETQGCAVHKEYAINVEKDYNLLAMTAFNINSYDERNRVFLPYALYERNVEFEMQIIDPSTSEVIFVTHSADQPWDGRNQKTGELVSANQRFIWSVRLKTKADFEAKSIYQGIVVRVTE